MDTIGSGTWPADADMNAAPAGAHTRRAPLADDISVQPPEPPWGSSVSEACCR